LKYLPARSEIFQERTEEKSEAAEVFHFTLLNDDHYMLGWMVQRPPYMEAVGVVDGAI
jgi:hypothetical protein